MTAKVLPEPVRPASVFISPVTPEAFGYYRNQNITTLASAAYVASQTAFYYPFKIYRPETVRRFFWVNGTTASTNNLQVGVYDTDGNSIKLGTSTLAAGASAAQFDNIADFVLPAGRYFMAIWCSGTTTHLLRHAPLARVIRMAGSFQQGSLASGLPATATFAAMANLYLPLFGLALRASP